MSGARWKLDRLRAMSPGEVLHRAGIALRDRAGAAWYLGPAGALADKMLPRASAPDRLDRFAHRPGRGAAGFEAAIEQASALGRGEWSAFGRPVRLADPPAWDADPRSGARWPAQPARTLDYHAAAAGDPKWTWELGRLTTLPVLALAGHVTGDPAPIARAARWAHDFVQRQPVGFGIHHTSGIEMAVRTIALTWTLALLDPGERRAFDARELASFAGQQALWCRDHLSLGSSANNHLLAEYAALAVAGGAFPALVAAEPLLERGLAGIAHELPRQILDDGVPAEQAFGYLPFVWELALAALIAGEAAGRKAPDALRARLARSLEFARAIRLPGGGMPHVGDEDDGRILLAGDDATRLDRVGDALAAWLGQPALADDAALARVLAGRTTAPRAAGDGRHAFPAGGYTVWRQGPWLVTFDHGPLGLGSLAAHGHADALSVTLHHGDRAVIADPGTFAYHGDPAARERCRSTPAHATVTFGGRSQSRALGPFLWGARAQVAAAEDGWRCEWWSGEWHWRAVEVTPQAMTVRDRVRGADAMLAFPLGAGAEPRLSGARADVRVGAVCAVFEAEGAGPWRIEPGEVASRFALRAPAPRLVAPIPGERCTTRITLAG
ncbi:MAG TPA: alginate lyase family protein [Candidatus Eisenbacteria bacterium]|nr:alginate lyase family protein [Candidatus Eisenbacteria bacterium]